MSVELDHIILNVNDMAKSVDFYVGVLGLTRDEDREPFSIVRVNSGMTIQLAPWGTQGGEHLAFAILRSEYDTVFERVKAAGIPYGDRFDSVGNMEGPGEELTAKGIGKGVYFFDPNKHLIEIRYYEA
jgi:catechol 2,3-dioxygenase-like lactoylglutathione lyase family enzyme